MARMTNRNVRGARSLPSILCGWLFKIFAVILSLFIIGIVVNIFSGMMATYVPQVWVTNLKKPTQWIFQNPLLVILIFIIFLLLMVIFYRESRRSSIAPIENVSPQLAATPGNAPPVPVQQASNGPPAEKDQERLYLQRMVRETEWLRLTGIPAGLVAPSVPLDDVFIPVEFFPRRLPSDYPLTKEELTRYRDPLRQGQFSEEMERVFVGTEKTWLDLLKKGEKVTIADLWQQLSRDNPVAVVQGYPGMGKSTLMARLTLHMARCGMGQPDPSMGTMLASPRDVSIPVLLLLKDYAIELEKAIAASNELSLIEYMQIAVGRLHIPGLFPFLQASLTKGRCLIMLDGLDEVSELAVRKRVKQAIESFVLDYHDTSSTSFNRFLITSRVAGYDVIAFADDYLHYTIADLTAEQIKDFLPRWCRASVRRGAIAPKSEQEEVISREAEQMAKKLSDAVSTHQGVGQLAQNPLLLTLLAAMQQNSIELPRQRVELYTVVTKTLLENRNLAKELKPIPETQAIQRLGPIAFKMQETGNSFARQREVKSTLYEIIKEDGGTPEEIEREVENFLSRIRERGGLFVIRTGDYFGFFHRTFQEYFAARHILNLIKHDPNTWIGELVNRARNSGDLWREPFLLAVAYQSGEDETIARRIMQELLKTPQNISFDQRAHDILLAADCLVETKPLTIGTALEKEIMQQLLQIYEEAQRRGKFDICQKIERGALRWLANLPSELYRPAPVLVMSEAISGVQHVKLQRASLTFLTMIAQQLGDSPPVVFDTLVPLLLALAGLLTIGKFQPAPNVPTSPDLNVADLALTVLSFMGSPGPAGQMLQLARQHFKEHPEQLRLLARNSLEARTLITPTVVLLTQENYKQYESAIEQWIALRDHYQIQRITERDIDTCLAIQQALLNCAEEARYPTTMHIVNMLQAQDDSPALPWQQTWQYYLLAQLSAERYISYQEVALLWAILFSDKQDQGILADLVLQHYDGNAVTLRRNAQRFIASLSNNLSDLSDLSDLRYLRYLRYLIYLSDLLDLLLLSRVMEQAIREVPSADTVQYGDFLAIVMGRVLQIQESQEINLFVEREVQKAVDVAMHVFTAGNTDEEVIEAALDILRYLPARSANEVTIIRSAAESTGNSHVYAACAQALEYARPEEPDAWTAIESCKQSNIKAIREAAEEALKRKK